MVETELHAAVRCNRIDDVRDILSQCDEVDDNSLEYIIQEQDDISGDQPAHIAARLGFLECMKLLVEYDAKMGKRNFAGLTPIGEARMHGNKEMVAFLNQHYTFQSNHKRHRENIPDNYNFGKQTARENNRQWDHDFVEQMDGWQQIWDIDRQSYFWVKESKKEYENNDKKIGDDRSDLIMAHPPSVNFNTFLERRQNCERRSVYRKIHPSLIPSNSQRKEEARKQELYEKKMRIIETLKSRKEQDCAIKLQSRYRVKKAERLRERKKIEYTSAYIIQYKWRKW